MDLVYGQNHLYRRSARCLVRVWWTWCSALPHLSLVLHLAATETGAYAIAYDFEVRRLIERLARRRDASADFNKLLCDENEEIYRYLKVDLGKSRANNQADAAPANAKFGKNAKAPPPAALPPPPNRRNDRTWANNRTWSHGSRNQAYDKSSLDPKAQGKGRGKQSK